MCSSRGDDWLRKGVPLQEQEGSWPAAGKLGGGLLCLSPQNFPAPFLPQSDQWWSHVAAAFLLTGHGQGAPQCLPATLEGGAAGWDHVADYATSELIRGDLNIKPPLWSAGGVVASGSPTKLGRGSWRGRVRVRVVQGRAAGIPGGAPPTPEFRVYGPALLPSAVNRSFLWQSCWKAFNL